MSIIVNGVNIPNTGDFIIAGGTNIDKVNVVKNGVTTTVWEKVKDFYVWKNGMYLSGYQPYSYVEKCTTGKSPSLQFETYNTADHGNCYGIKATGIYTDGNDSLIYGFKIPTIVTNGRKFLDVIWGGYQQDRKGGSISTTVDIYGITSSGVTNQLFGGWYEHTKTNLDISGYAKIDIDVRVVCGVNGGNGSFCSNEMNGSYLYEVYLHG